MKFFLYILSLLIPIAGIIIGIVFQSRPDPESKGLGRTCLILGIVSFVLTCCLTVVMISIWPILVIWLQEYALVGLAIA
jgi:hypothetical protein